MITHQAEPQRTGDRRRLDELDGDRIAKTMRCRAADECAPGLVEAEIFIADAACRDETVGAGFVEFDKKTGTRDSGNVSVENGANAVG